jgi:hypothetical protein
MKDPMLKRFGIAMLLAAGFCAAAGAKPPTDPEAKKLYDHDYEWLAPQAPGFIATNIRGENDKQYPERRQAALDLLRVKQDRTTVPEMMDELQRRSFLSAEICQILGEWNARKAAPLLTEVAEDKTRPKAVRAEAKKALQQISVSQAEAHAPSRPVY